MIVHCAKSTYFVRSIFACASGVYYKTEESGMELNIETKMNIRVRGIHWQKIRIKHTQMKGKQCNLLFRAWLCYSPLLLLSSLEATV